MILWRLRLVLDSYNFLPNIRFLHLSAPLWGAPVLSPNTLECSIILPSPVALLHIQFRRTICTEAGQYNSQPSFASDQETDTAVCFSRLIYVSRAEYITIVTMLQPIKPFVYRFIHHALYCTVLYAHLKDSCWVGLLISSCHI